MKRMMYVLMPLVVLLMSCGDGEKATVTPDPGQKEEPKPEPEPEPEPEPDTSTAIDFSESGLHPLDIKRGYILRAAMDRLNSNIMDQLEEYPQLGMKLVALPRDLNQFDENWESNPHGDYFRSYRSMGSTYFGGNGEKEEFSRNTGGDIEVRINTGYLQYCKKARELGLQMIIQCSGVPVEGKNDGSVEHLFPLDDRRTFHKSARYYPLPAAGNYEANGKVIFEWMKALHDELGADNTIYAGNQEPSHTTGYFNGTQTDAASIQNLQVYPVIWRSTALQLQSAGMLSASSQLNEVHSHYDPSVESLTSKGVPFDFYSIQNYKAENNAVIMASAKAALEKYGVPTDKKVLLNRYCHGTTNELKTNDERFGSAAGMVAFLNAELVLCDYADMVYGYCYFTGAQTYDMQNAVFTFLNAMPEPRKRIKNLPAGLKYIASADEEKVAAVIWNPGVGDVTFNLDASGALGDMVELSILKGSGSLLTDCTPEGWGASRGKMEGLELGSREFMMISIVL